MTRLAAALLLVSLPAFAAEPLAPPGAPAERFPQPDRPVAEIVAPQWAHEKQRDRADEVGQVARLMRIGPGETVADIGAGNGYYVFRLSPRVGPGGRILAQDITPDYLAELERRVAEAGLANVTVVRGEAPAPDRRPEPAAIRPCRDEATRNKG